MSEDYKARKIIAAREQEKIDAKADEYLAKIDGHLKLTTMTTLNWLNSADTPPDKGEIIYVYDEVTENIVRSYFDVDCRDCDTGFKHPENFNYLSKSALNLPEQSE